MNMLICLRTKFFKSVIYRQILVNLTSKLIILPDNNDINYFKSAGLYKSNNDMYNKIRENVIANIFNIGDDYFNDPIYGADWKTFKQKFTTSILGLCEFPFETISIKHMGGMSYNYDFKLSFIDKNKKIMKSVKLEFKHNNSNVSKLIQFIELYDRDCKKKYNLCHISYAEYYYDNYLDKYIETDNDFIYQKPNKIEYLNFVSDVNYKHKFFNLLYKKKNIKMKIKKEIANESVREYIKLYSSTFNFDKITEKIKESQTNKVFLLWDCNEFHIQTLVDIKNISISGIKKIDNLSFSVNVINFEYDICVRLRWSNNNGLANPSWKFSFIPK
jgi:hypothetical protein